MAGQLDRVHYPDNVFDKLRAVDERTARLERALRLWESTTTTPYMDADMLDGHHGSYYLDRTNHSGVQAPATISPQGAASTLDADLLDGSHASAFSLTSHAHSLDQITNPAAGKSFAMANNNLVFSYAAPVGADGAFEIEATGAYSGDLMHIHQHTGNPGAVDLVHLEAAGADVTLLRFEAGSARAPMVLGANCQGQTVVGLKADQLNKSVIAGNGLTNGGALTGDVTLNVGVSGLGLSVTADAVVLASSSNPGAAESILATDASGYVTVVKLCADTIADKSGGDLTIAPAGDIVLNPTGNDVSPTTNYDINLGSPTKKYLTLHAAELWVGTLIAHETMATIGGEIFVGPTTELVEDLAASTAARIVEVKHNQMLAGDTAYFEANGSVEFVLIGSLNILSLSEGSDYFSLTGDYTTYFPAGYTFKIEGSDTNNGVWTVDHSTFGGIFTSVYVTGDLLASSTLGGVTWANYAADKYAYLYVTRDRDGTGANAWPAGTALGNTGAAGDGFIELYSVRGIKEASDYGPTIVGNVRLSDTFNDWAEHWAIGNLNGLYGYSADTYGAALGKYAANIPWVGVDAANGVRIMRYTTQLAQWDTSGNILVGQAAASQSNVYITAGALQLRNNTTIAVQLDATGDAIFGTVGASKFNLMWDASEGDLLLRLNTTATITLDGATGDAMFGEVAASKFNLMWDASEGDLLLRQNTTAYFQVDGSASLMKFGQNVSAAATTAIAVLGADQTYNSESLGAGDLLIGDNSASKANILWDKSAGKLQFRGGTTMQVEISTDGTLLAGGGNVVIGTSGIRLNALTGKYGSAAIEWDNGATNHLSIGTEVDLGAVLGTYIESKLGLSIYTLDSGSHVIVQTASDAFLRVVYDAQIGGGLVVGNVATDPAADTIVCDGKIYIGDTSDANVTVGLVVNQGANDDKAITLKSSDIAHGITDVVETDTYCTFCKWGSTAGGFALIGLSEDVIACGMAGYATNDNTAKTTAATAPLTFRAAKKSGTTVGAVGADANLLVIQNYTTTRVIFDAEGSNHTDVEWTTFDAHDDMALLDTLERTALARNFGDWCEANRAELERLNLAHFDDKPGHAMVNWTRLSMLLVGAVRQLAAKQSVLESKLLSA